MCEGVGEDSRHGFMTCRHSSRNMLVLLECVVCHCMCTYVRSSSCRNYSLLGFAHLVMGPPFKYRETALRRGCDYEEGQHVALSNFCKSICIK